MSDGLASPFAPIDTINEFNSVVLPHLKDIFRGCLQEELDGIREDIAFLIGAMQELKETLPSQKMQVATRSCGSKNNPEAQASGAPVPEVHKHEGETSLRVPHRCTDRNHSVESNNISSNGNRILRIASARAEVDQVFSRRNEDTISSGKKRSPGLQALEEWQANDLLCPEKLADPVRPPDLESQLQGIAPASPVSRFCKKPIRVIDSGVTSTFVKKTEALRQIRETQLAGTDGDHPLELSTWLFFGVWGIFPLAYRKTSGSRHLARYTAAASACYRRVVLSVMLGLLACSSLQPVLKVPYGSGCSLLSDWPLVCGSVAILLASGATRNNADLACCFQTLTFRSWKAGCLDWWIRDSRKEIIVSLCIWVCAVASRLILAYTLVRPVGQISEACFVFSVLPFAISSGAVLAAACCGLHICLALEGLIDAFCSKFIAGTSIEDAVQDWNELQAMIRKACATIQGCFFLLLCIVMWAVLLAGADLAMIPDTATRVASFIPSMIIVVGIARVFFNAAEVTNKCGRVPPLINSLDFGTRIDLDRQYIVDYIIRSAAGFYVYETRVTSVLVAKFLYLCFVLAASLTGELMKL